MAVVKKLLGCYFGGCLKCSGGHKDEEQIKGEPITIGEEATLTKRYAMLQMTSIHRKDV